MNKFLCCTVAAFVTVTASAQAEDLYLGASISSLGTQTAKLNVDGVRYERDADKRHPDLGLFAGYVLSPSWAVEAGYRGTSGSSVFALEQGYQLKTSTNMGYLAARNTWQLSEDWSLYGKVGVAQGRFKVGLSSKEGSASETVKKNGLYLGLGMAYMVSKDVSLQLELEHTDKLKRQGLSLSMDKISLGARFGF